MKKLFVLLIAILVGVFLIFSYLDQNGEYAAEKSIWKINKEFSTITKDPDRTPKASFVSVVKQYDAFIAKYSNSQLIPVAYVLSGRAYVHLKEYDKARGQFEKVISNFPGRKIEVMQAIVEIGRTYAVESDANGVLSHYARVVKEYPFTEIGMRTPMLIAKFHADQNNIAQAKESFNDAAVYYTKLIEEHPNTKIAYTALKLKGTAYVANDRFEEAIEVFRVILFDYSTPEFMDLKGADHLIKTINTLSVAKLKNYDLPIKIYQDFMEQNPKHPFSLIFTDMIKNFKLLKEKKIGVTFK